jgi:hypothetical protein
VAAKIWPVASHAKNERLWDNFADPLTSSDTTGPKQPLDDTNAKTASRPSHRLQLSLKAKKRLSSRYRWPTLPFEDTPFGCCPNLSVNEQ